MLHFSSCSWTIIIAQSLNLKLILLPLKLFSPFRLLSSITYPIESFHLRTGMVKSFLMKPVSQRGADIAAAYNQSRLLPEDSGVQSQQSFVDLNEIFLWGYVLTVTSSSSTLPWRSKRANLTKQELCRFFISKVILTGPICPILWKCYWRLMSMLIFIYLLCAVLSKLVQKWTEKRLPWE